MKQLEEQRCERLFFVLGVVGDKDLDSIIPLLPKRAYYFFTQASTPRAMNAETLAQRCTSAGLHGEVVVSVGEAVQKAVNAAKDDDLVFVGGSTYVVGEVRVKS
jgi:dihydrofolate synthase/folylpolyglutamate synthase